jgi:uncharacterized protein (DUF58 family)
MNSAPRNSMKIRMTVVGVFFLGLTLVIAVSAVHSELPLMHLVFGGMAGAFVVSSMSVRAMLHRIQVRRDLPERAYQGEPIPFAYTLRNPRRSSALGLSVREQDLQGMEESTGYCLSLPGGGAFRAGARLCGMTRGHFDLSAVTVESTFPLGLLRGTLRCPQCHSLVVWPAKGTLLLDPFMRDASAEGSAAPSRHLGGEDDMFGLRDYRTGDSPRWIHWRRSAGRPLPVVREMTRAVPETLLLIVDTSEARDDDSPTSIIEKRLRLATTVLDHAVSRGYRVGLVMASGDSIITIRPACDVAHHRELLDAMGQFSPAPGIEFGDVQREAERMDAGRSQWLVLTDAQRSFGSPGSQTLVISSRSMGRWYRDAEWLEGDHATG